MFLLPEKNKGKTLDNCFQTAVRRLYGLESLQESPIKLMAVSPLIDNMFGVLGAVCRKCARGATCRLRSGMISRQLCLIAAWITSAGQWGGEERQALTDSAAD